MELVNLLTVAERKRIRSAVVKELERYRIFQSALNLEQESAIYTADQLKQIQEFCKRIENAVNELPYLERHIITERYLNLEADYITDSMVYKQLSDPPITSDTYIKYRDRAMFKLAFLIGVDCGLFNC